MSPANIGPHVKAKDEVAVMPLGVTSPSEVVGITRVRHAGHLLIQTDDSRMYAATDGVDVCGIRSQYIVPATEEHRAELRRRECVNR